ncbi:MAG: phenylacetate-CoA oxygenase/reductase subunit PaaK [Sphingobacteriales bacterium]|nr:MAG: phenylacetate-CoA oxygenase/reductase subunit PaaK [Sphingobacteriales bacterium]
MARFYPLPILDVRRELSDCVSVAFDLTPEAAAAFPFKAGQYLTVRTTIDGEEVRRSYSICSAPASGELRVAIKQVADGKFSTWANTELKKGDVLEVMAPDGRFTVRHPQKAHKHYLAIAAGSGITPVLSLLTQILQTEPDSTCTLIYGNRTRGSILFRETLEGLKNAFMQRLRIYHVLSREAMDVPLFSGRIDGAKAAAFMERLVPPNTIDEAFICGPEEMILSVRDALADAGVPEDRIHFELFTATGAAALRKKAPSTLTQEAAEAKSRVRITLDGSTTELELAYGGDSILDAALKAGADLPYACKGGVCATCRARLIEGEVEMELSYGLEKDEIAKGFVLTCQSHPRTPVVAVDFDQR